MSSPPSNQDETSITELTIAPDGRVFVFGTSRPVLEVLLALNPHDRRVGRLVEQVQRVEGSVHT